MLVPLPTALVRVAGSTLRTVASSEMPVAVLTPWGTWGDGPPAGGSVGGLDESLGRRWAPPPDLPV